MKKIFLIVTALYFAYTTDAQTTVLNEYIKQGLESNLIIKQNQMALESAQYALLIAKGMYLPTISTQSRYTFSKGGRTIDFPIGDLLNPVYSTLNDLLVSQGGTAQFPMVENQRINFLREKEYEAKLSLTQPLYYPSIAINKRIEEQKLYMTETEMKQYQRDLTFQIKEAYYNYMKVLNYYDLIQKTKEVVNENHRVSLKLLENNMITRDGVLRAKSEVSKVDLLETEAEKNKEMAKNYFNFLLNRNLDDEVIVVSQSENYLTLDNLELGLNALQNREELKLLDQQIRIMDHVADLSRSEMFPRLILAADYGIQGEDLKIDNESDFLTASVVLQWDIFNGNTKRNKKKQALIEKQRIGFIKEEAQDKIQLEVKQDVFEVQQQHKNLNLAKTRCNEANEFYRIIEKRFRLGEVPLIELLDARNNMTEAETQFIVAQYDYLTSIARLEKSTAKSLQL
ncbi:MAG: hypothetical protein A2W99_01535 [Bacteroidetes bacterium GWF2_33_16]|nr:MAG: hypothetical protein A2X00_16620 [Bacteroidetes bacterium GWE2_32_14]OFY06953.1 MAG: hypothetical protein A2W99_01535 [Bacteroidetes bacterium GWF2_33_16]